MVLGLDIIVVPTSKRTEEQARSLGIPLSVLDENPCLDLASDGADEVDSDLNLVRGRDGALLREMMVAEAEIMYQQSIPVLDVKYHLYVAQENSIKVEVSPKAKSVPIVRVLPESDSTETSRFESVVVCSEIIEDSILEAPAPTYTPNVRSGSCGDIGLHEDSVNFLSQTVRSMQNFHHA